MIQFVDCHDKVACLEAFKRLFDGSPFPISISDVSLPDAPTVYINPAFTQMTGYTPADIIGRNCRILQGNDILQVGSAVIGSAIKRRVAEQAEILNYRKDGSQFWNLLRVMPLMTNCPQAQYMVGLQLDATDVVNPRLALEHALEAEKEQREQALHIERLQSMGTMAASIAHEINNPTAAVLMNLNYLTDIVADGSATQDELSEVLAETTAEVVRIGRLVTSLLDFGRKKQSLEPMSVNFKQAILPDLNFMLHGHLIDHQVACVQDIPDDLPLVRISPDALKQIMINLLTNAVDALKICPEPREVVLSAQVEPRFVCFMVQDNGCGVPETLRKRIFEAFVTTKEKGKGTGLGLSLSASLAAEFGGGLMLDDRYTSGALFKLYVPIAQP